MRIVKLFIVVAILAAALFAGWKLTIGTGSDNSASSGEISGALYERTHRDVLRAISLNFNAGWNAQGYNEVLEIIEASGLDERSRANLRDLLANGIVRKLDSLICSEYADNYPQSDTRTIATMANNYNGLTQLTTDFPNLSSSEAVIRLNKDREIIDGIYAFSREHLVPGTRVHLAVVPEGDSYGLDWNLSLADYSAYTATLQNRRSTYLSQWQSMPDLISIPWVSNVLSERTVAQRIESGRNIYLNNERRIVSDFLQGLPSNPLLRDNVALRIKIGTNDLRALRDNLGGLSTPQLRQAVERAAATLNRSISVPELQPQTTP